MLQGTHNRDWEKMRRVGKPGNPPALGAGNRQFKSDHADSPEANREERVESSEEKQTIRPSSVSCSSLLGLLSTLYFLAGIHCGGARAGTSRRLLTAQTQVRFLSPQLEEVIRPDEEPVLKTGSG